MTKQRQRISRISRRQFIQVSGSATAGIVLAACGASIPVADEAFVENANQEDDRTGASESSTQYNEAPMLANRVSSGDLPLVDDRLPVTPKVIPVAEQIGNYGGSFRRGFKGVSDRAGPHKMKDHQLVWYDQDLNLQPHVAESWDVSDDAMEWTFILREGMRWSDGHPFTTADIQWWWDHDETNKAITPVIDTDYVTGPDRTPMEIEVIDEVTIKFKFAHPKPLFIFELTRFAASVYLPGHYLSQFHMELTDDQDALKSAVDKAGFSTWVEYYVDRRWWYLNPDLPEIGPWLAKNELSNELFLMERNPYYFGVDAAGNQLPYVDVIQHRLFGTPDVFDLWIVNGEIDFQARHVSIGNFTLYKESEDKGDYQVYIGPRSSHIAIQLNLSTKNEQLREFFQKRDVRLALSAAVDREAINELVYDGLLTPRQYSPISASPQYYPTLSNAHLTYDADYANTLLDEAGYAEKNNRGERVWPDTTEVISFIIEGTAVQSSVDENAIQQIINYYNAIGIQASYKSLERSLYTEHFRANEIEAAFWGGDRTVLPIVDSRIFTGEMIDRPWAAGWGIWKNSGGTDPNSEEPPEDHWIRNIWDIHDKVTAEADSTKQQDLFTEILDIWAKELPMIGYLGEMPGLVIVKNGVRNYLPGQPLDNTTGDEHLLNTETYFWDDPASHS